MDTRDLAFQPIFDQYWAHLLRYLLKAHRVTEQEAMEVVQDTLLGVWKHHDSGDSITPALVFAILRNKVIDYLKHKDRRIPSTTDNQDAQLDLERAPPPSLREEAPDHRLPHKIAELERIFTQAELSELQAKIMRAITAQMVHCPWLLEPDYSEIALAVGCSIATLRVTLMRAREKVRPFHREAVVA